MVVAPCLSLDFSARSQRGGRGFESPLVHQIQKRLSLLSLTQLVLQDCPTGPVEVRILANLSKQLYAILAQREEPAFRFNRALRIGKSLNQHVLFFLASPRCGRGARHLIEVPFSPNQCRRNDRIGKREADSLASKKPEFGLVCRTLGEISQRGMPGKAHSIWRVIAAASLAAIFAALP